MKIAGADIGATNVGLATWDGGLFNPSSWHPKESGPGTDIEYELEGRRLEEWQYFFWSWLVGEGIQALGFEQPFRSDMRRFVPGETPEDDRIEVAATTMKTVYRTYNMTGAAIAIATKLHIPVYPVSACDWRKPFIGVCRAPKTDETGAPVTDGRMWLKKRAREECTKRGVVTRNNDQGDAVGICWYLRGALHLDGVGAKPGDLFASAGVLKTW